MSAAETVWYWCQSCQLASKHVIRKCLHCGLEDSEQVIEITWEYAEQRLKELRAWRRFLDATKNPDVPRCPKCGGVALDSAVQKYLSSGRRREASDDRWSGPARIIFSASNVTGGSTAEVKACRCQKER